MAIDQKHFKNNLHEEFLPYFSSCRTSNRFLNVDFIGQDETKTSGHMLYLTTISEFLRSLFQPFENEEKVTVILPEVEGKTVQQLMSYIYTGAADIQGYKEKANFIKLARQFGVSIGERKKNMKKTPTPERSVPNSQTNISKASEGKPNVCKRSASAAGFNDDQVTPEGKTVRMEELNLEQDKHDSLYESSTESVEVKVEPSLDFFEPEVENSEDSTWFDSNNKTGKPKVLLPCALCSSHFDRLSGLLSHLSVSHFAHELKELQDASEGICPVCAKIFDGVGSKERFAKHVGSAHKKVLDFLPEETKAQLEPLIKPYRSSTKLTPNVPPCGLCNMEQQSIHALLAHLSSSHFSFQLKESFETNNGQCPFCPKKFEGTEGHVSRARDKFVKHVGSTHRMVLEYLPKELQDPLQSLVDKKEIQNLPLPPCGICGKEPKNGSPYEYLSHLMKTHYNGKFFGMFQSNDGVCPVCAKKYEGKGAKRSYEMHVGITHRMVMDYLPDQIRKVLSPYAKLQNKKE